ncbi:MAG TPA: phospholipid carrier-dependent glycosyltransferase [Mycobacteriales bacterium]|nr:phospholipid carrier-dependent glycosyltransferase [Mycobacteriales bacterium]
MAATYAEPGVSSPERGELARIRARLVRPLPDDGIWGWLLPLAITGVAALLRFWHLGRPSGVVFDEVYYEHDAWSLLHHGVELDKSSGDQTAGFVVHPPIGKWMIAVGEALFGHNAFGWRFAAAVVGTLAIFMVARIGRRLFRSTFLGCVAALLLTFDGLEFVQSRMAMLDIFLMFWVLAAFGCLVLDRDDGRRRLAARIDGAIGERRGPWLGVRPWRLGCAVCVGLACATKWNGIFWLPVFFVLMLFWDAGARRVAGARHAFASAVVVDGLAAAATFIVVPVAVYVASWTGWFLSDGKHAYDHDRYVHPGQSWLSHDLAVIGGWLRYHWEIYHFHSNLDSAHPYLSRPAGWLLLIRPVAYYYASPHGCGASSCSQEVLGVGTPALWWATIPAFVAVAWRWISRRDWRAALLVVTFLAGYLPWFYEDAHHRTMFLFYLLPAVPFMALLVAMTLGMALGEQAAAGARRIVGSVVVGAYLVVLVANFAWLRPVLSADVITYKQWHHRMLFTTCDQTKDRNEHHENAPCWI